TTGITACVGLLHELKETNHMLIINSITMELFQQIEDEMWLLFLQSFPDDTQIIVKTDRQHLMPHFSKGGDDIIFSFPGLDLRFGQTFNGLWGYQTLPNQYNDAQPPFHLEAHTAIL